MTEKKDQTWLLFAVIGGAVVVGVCACVVVAILFFGLFGVSSSMIMGAPNQGNPNDPTNPDRALYLVNRDGTLAVNQGQVTIPLVINPNFGKPLVHYGNGGMLRIGLQVNH